jgi:hypothetical protein
LPNAKIVVTAEWTLLTGSEKLRFQGLSFTDINALGLAQLCDADQSDLAGNMLLGSV